MPARILVAEDDSSVRTFVFKALSLRGHDVATVDDGVQALEALKKEAFQLLVTDIVMPGLDGIALALRAGRDYPDLPILLMTGYSAERQRAHNLDRLAIRFILKPFTLQQIRDAVEETLSQAAAAPRVAAQAYTVAR
jgi:DNA-binding NtrC family response regulator